MIIIDSLSLSLPLSFLFSVDEKKHTKAKHLHLKGTLVKEKRR
jgi:hypothetical protein